MRYVILYSILYFKIIYLIVTIRFNVENNYSINKTIQVITAINFSWILIRLFNCNHAYFITNTRLIKNTN